MECWYVISIDGSGVRRALLLQRALVAALALLAAGPALAVASLLPLAWLDAHVTGRWLTNSTLDYSLGQTDQWIGACLLWIADTMGLLSLGAFFFLLALGLSWERLPRYLGRRLLALYFASIAALIAAWPRLIPWFMGQ